MDRLKIVRDPKTLRAISKLHTLCFGDNYFHLYATRPKEFGDIYILTLNRDTPRVHHLRTDMVATLLLSPISQVLAIHPHSIRKLGWGLKMLNAILTDLFTRPDCHTVYADIRQSNVASQQLFKKAGFYIYRESRSIL